MNPKKKIREQREEDDKLPVAKRSGRRKQNGKGVEEGERGEVDKFWWSSAELPLPSFSLSFYPVGGKGWRNFPRPSKKSAPIYTEWRGWRWGEGSSWKRIFEPTLGPCDETCDAHPRLSWEGAEFQPAKLFLGETSPFICMRCRNRFTLYLYRCINKGLKGKGWRWINRTDLDGNRGWVSGKKVSSFHLYRGNRVARNEVAESDFS